MALKRIHMAGFGGQGILLIGKLVAHAAMLDDKEVTWMPAYGPEMRGGTANCTVCIDDEPITSPVVDKCEVLIAMNGPSLEKFEHMLVPGGDLFINTNLCPNPPKRTDINVHYVDSTKIAEETFGSAKAANMVMLGALTECMNEIGLEDVISIMKHEMEKKPQLIEINEKAIRKGAELARAQL